MGSSSTERMRALRARRAATLIPVDGQAPLPEADQLAPAVAETLAALDLGPEHAGAVQLARRYAAVIDQAADPAWAMRWVAPELLKVLEQLQATPMSRPKAPPGPQGSSRLDQLRASRSTSDRSRGRL